MKKKFVLVIGITILLIVASYFSTKFKNGGEVIPIEARYSAKGEHPEKIVYSADPGANTISLRADCARRGGEFSTCASPNDPDSAIHLTVCRFACFIYSE